jgi:prevent-host-death family protein
MTTIAQPRSRPRGRTYRRPYDQVVARRVLIGIQEMRLRLKPVVDMAINGTHVVFTRRGRPVTVLVPIDWYRKAAEAVGDPTEIEAYDAATTDHFNDQG